MEDIGSILLLAGMVALIIPILAIAAFVRTSGFLRKLEEQANLISHLSRELDTLRASIAQVSAQATEQSTPAPLKSAVETISTRPAIPVAPPVEKPAPAPPTSIPEQVKVQIVEPPTPKPVLPQESITPPIERIITTEPPKEVPVTAQASVSGPPPVIPKIHTTPVQPLQPPSSAAPPVSPAPPPRPVQSETTGPAFANIGKVANSQRRKSLFERLRTTLPLEELLGTNLFAKIGIVLLVLGLALFGRVALGAMGPGGKVALSYAAAATLLGGGIWLERKERYRLVGRAGIGGGWALLFFTTYAMYHVPAMHVMGSNTLNCILLLGVAGAMVGHTLRYQSQAVTGLSFLLAFSTVALSQDTVYALAAGVILTIGIVAIALRMGWYELEVFGILSSYLNHFYWLHKLYPEGIAGHSFPQFWPSAIILILYWLVFRISYVARRIRTPRDERISTIAALLNTSSLLAVMKFQSTHPELAFYALLAIGAVEFFFGQLPTTRRRRPAFILLSVFGTMLMFASVPFKFSGNSIALLWMIAAEALLIAGIAQKEVVFRRLGLISGIITGLLIAYEARAIIEFRQYAESPLIKDGVLLLTCCVLFYLNAHFIRNKWRQLFESIDGKLASTQSYIGCITAFLGVWAIFTRDWTALGWATLLLGAAFGARRLSDKHLLAQGWFLAIAVTVRGIISNLHVDEQYPHHVTARLIALPLLALSFYLTAWLLSGVSDLRISLRSLTLWAGSSSLVALAWLDVSSMWVALVWMALAVIFGLVSRRLKLTEFSFQEHVLAFLIVIQLLMENLDSQYPIERYLPILCCAAALYAISRFCTLQGAGYRRFAGWAHTWTATGLLAALAWHESPQLWLAVIWIVFALALAIVDRVFQIEELPYQTHVLAGLAVIRAVTLNVYTLDKWHRLDLRMLTLSSLAIVLYALTRWVRIPQRLRERDAHHIYSWLGSGLTAWMLWCELQPVSVALGLAVFGLVLFEWGDLQKQLQLRRQAYVIFAAAFIRIFFVNLTAAAFPGELLSPRIYTVVPIALIYFFVWAQLQSNKEHSEKGRSSVSNVLAYLGTGCIVSLLYFQVHAEWIVLAWAVLLLVLMIAAFVLDKEIFLQQASLLLVALVTRGIAHNIFGGSYFTANGWRGNFAVLLLTIGLQLATLPLAFRLRDRYAKHPMQSKLSRTLALHRPDQLFFFAPVVLATLMIVVKMNPGMVTLAWGVEGVIVILLGLTAGQRSYRITGLFLLLLCVGKIICRDAWRLAERDRYITFIVLGAALTAVSMLYNKYRESVRRLL